MAPVRIKLQAVCNTADKVCKKNAKLSRRYPRVEWGVLKYPPCAVVGGSPNLVNSLHILRKWTGDIFAVNATAKYLSDQGIPCYLYAIDCDPDPKAWGRGELVKGAVFSSRVNREQFKMFKRAEVRTFDMAEEDNYKGIEGGPTAICRAPHLFLRMGYRAVYFFGVDGCFTDTTHITGTQEVAHVNMVVIRVNDVDYLTNAAFLLQNEYLLGVFQKYPDFLINASGGLLAAMQQHPDTWEVVAIQDGLKVQYDEKGGGDLFRREFQFGEKPLWRPQQTS